MNDKDRLTRKQLETKIKDDVLARLSAHYFPEGHPHLVGASAALPAWSPIVLGMIKYSLDLAATAGGPALEALAASQRDNILAVIPASVFEMMRKVLDAAQGPPVVKAEPQAESEAPVPAEAATEVPSENEQEEADES